jgi:ribosome-associated protein
MLTSTQLRDLVISALEERKAKDIVALDVAASSPVTDFMIIASGTSNRHVNALVDEVVTAAKARDAEVLGVEGRETGEWVLVDLGDVLVHVMQAEPRAFYDLERLWAVPSPAAETQRLGV